MAGAVLLSSLPLAAVLHAPPAAAGSDLETVRAEIAQLRRELEVEDERLTAAREQSFALEHDIADLSARQSDLAERIARKRARLETLRDERERAAADLAETRELLEHNLLAHYALAMQPRLKLLLNQDRARTLSRNLAYYDYVNRAYRRDLGDLRHRVAALERTTAAIKLEATTLRRLRHESAEQLGRLETMRDEHAELVAAIEARMSDGATRLAQLEADERELMALVEGLAGRAEPRPERPFGSLKGALAWPVDGAVAKAPGSALRKGGARWSGVLIASPPGTPVRAVAAGEVVYADWFRNLGRLVIVDHGDGFMTLYGNTAEIATEAGARVAAGDTIATVGDGSGEMPAGLYFELRAEGRPLDPRTWCAAR